MDARFDSVADVYERHRPDYPDSFIRFVQAELGRGPDSVCCDLGCGSGKFSKRIIDRVSRLDGVDPSQRMLDVAVASLPAQFHPVRATGEHYVAADQYDGVFISHAFHWMDAAKVLRNVHASLRAEGLVAIFWNNCLDQGSALRRDIKRLVHTYHQHPSSEYRGRNTLELLSRSNSFFPAEHRPFRFTHTSTPAQYLGLLASKSYVAHDIAPQDQQAFFDQARPIVDRWARGGTICESYQTDVYFARKKS